MLKPMPLSNRDEFVGCLDSLVSDCTVGLLVVDIKNFKRINHVFGLNVADQLLDIMVERFRGAGLNRSKVFRVGANEFAIVLSELLDPHLIVLAAGKVARVSEEPIEIMGRHIQLKVHIGYASNADISCSAEDLLRHAELLLVEAKSAGVVYVDYDEDRLVTPYDWQLESELNQAIAGNELELYFQPKISLRDGLTIHLEALSRWKHPERGMVSPVEFIPLAEQTGAIKALTKWALHTALRSASEWPDHPGGYSVAVNLSVQVLEDEDLLNQVSAALNIWGIAPECLTLEVTESAFVNEGARGVQRLHELKALGVCISIDDFGTGYSCLSYFKHIPADELKIDKTFIDHLLEDEGDQHLVQLMINLGHHFDMSIVAEGIENEETFDMLKRMGCDYAQGFYRARPMPQHELLVWLEKFKEGNV